MTTRLVLLAPRHRTLSFPSCFRKQVRQGRTEILAQLQRFRAQVYLADGAITRAQITGDGRHAQDADYSAWHFALLDAADQVRGCLRLMVHGPATSINDLSSSRAAVLQDPLFGGKVAATLQRHLFAAHRDGKPLVEVGGWAVDDALRASGEAVSLVLASFAFGRALGGARGLCTATVRHHSASILRRIGARRLAIGAEELPPYFDPSYGCEMELLSFESNQLDPKFERLMGTASRLVSESPVFTDTQLHTPAMPRKFPFAWGQMRWIGSTFVEANA